MSFTARRGGYESFSGSPPAQFSLATTRTGIPMSSSDQFYKEVPPFATGSPAAQFSPGTTKTGIPVSASDQFYKEIPPLHTQPKPKTRLPWSTGLFDCFSDWRTCCMTCWCPCVTFGRIAEIVDKGSSACGVNGALYALLACVTGCCCCYSCFYRTKMRQQHMLQEGPCPDCCLHCFCEYCALCQEYRELTSRGFDLPIGWHGNLEKQSREVPLPPVVEEGMSR